MLLLPLLLFGGLGLGLVFWFWDWNWDCSWFTDDSPMAMISSTAAAARWRRELARALV